MNSFFDLFESHSTPEGWADPTWADRRFPEVVAANPFRLWKPGDAISVQDTRFLLGVATWSGYDMRLLDAIAETLAPYPNDRRIVELFNTADCPHPPGFRPLHSRDRSRVADAHSRLLA
jgi:hypothetical protein